MNNSLVSVKWGAASKLWRLSLFPLVLLFFLLLPQTALAQKQPYADLYLTLRDSRNEYYNYNARADQDNKFFLDVRNNGTKPAADIKVSSEPPQGWTIQINPSSIAILNAGQSTTLDVIIRPTGDGNTRGYQVNFTVEAAEISRKVQSFFITVKPAQQWLWVWAGVGVLVIAGFVLIYLRMNKQQ